jgi:hypothetical protein
MWKNNSFLALIVTVVIFLLHCNNAEPIVLVGDLCENIEIILTSNHNEDISRKAAYLLLVSHESENYKGYRIDSLFKQVSNTKKKMQPTRLDGANLSAFVEVISVDSSTFYFELCVTNRESVPMHFRKFVIGI